MRIIYILNGRLRVRRTCARSVSALALSGRCNNINARAYWKDQMTLSLFTYQPNARRALDFPRLPLDYYFTGEGEEAGEDLG